jgi:hypothetical protein
MFSSEAAFEFDEGSFFDLVREWREVLKVDQSFAS